MPPVVLPALLHASHALPRSLRRAARRLGRDEAGTMTVFGLFLFLMMLIVGGMAVDIMRFETNRARLQATLDRAVLAASDLDQTEDPEAVLRDYFRAAGLLDQLGPVQVTSGINSRTVSASASMDIDTLFMDLVGVESLEAPAAGTANETVADIEIVLVLDVSGSMGEASGTSTKIALLRAAARDFARTVLEADTDRRVSIAVVPFNAQVNLGPTLLAAWDASYDVTNLHGWPNSACIDMPTSAFAAPGIPAQLALPQAGFFDGYTATTQNHTSYVAPQGQGHTNQANYACRTDERNFVRLPSQTISTLEGQLQNLQAVGNTSITMGMKWAMAFLDPSARGFFATQIAAGRMPGTLAGRPYAWDRENTLKVVVLMTDGEHVASRQLDPGYRTELAPIWRYGSGAANWRYSYFRDRPGTANDYWVPHFDPDNNSANGVPGAWQCRPWSGAAPEDGCGGDDDDDVGVVTQMRWHELWANHRMSWVAWQLMARGADCPAGSSGNSCRVNVYNAYMSNSVGDASSIFTSDTSVPQMDSSLQQSCAQARANNVVVYGIAFEAPANGRTQISGCASSPSHYYDAQGLEIATVFRSIAAQINALRLTQ